VPAGEPFLPDAGRHEFYQPHVARYITLQATLADTFRGFAA
jgi:hypothetical protein